MQRRAALLPALLLVACGRDASLGARRDEAARVVRAIDQVIAANDGAKGPPLAVLEATPCTDAAACGAKDACVAAFRPLVTAFALRDEVRGAMKAPGAAASIEALQAKAEAAETAQKEASTKMGACLQAAAEARRVAAP